MNYFDNISYMISHLFLMSFIYLFITHRYSARVTRLICLSSFLLLSFTDVIKLNIFPNSDTCYFLVTVLQIFITQLTGIFISSKRNSNVLFIGLSASNYTILGSVLAPIMLINTRSMVLALAANFAIHFVILYILYKSLRDIWLRQYENEYIKGWPELCLIPALFYCSFSCIAFFPYTLYDNPQNIPGILCMMLTMCVSYVVVLRYIESDSNRKDIYYKNVLFETYIRGLENQYYMVEKSEKKLRILRHDMRHYSRLIHQLLSQGEYEEIDKIMAHINDVMDESRVTKYCKNLIVNAIISEVIKWTDKFGITVTLDLVVPEKIPVNHYEFTAVIANLFENAISCVKDYEEAHRYIEMKVHCTEDHLLIQVKNECHDALTFDTQTGLPKSEKGVNHGLGMQSVLAFSEKTGGTIDCFCENNLFQIILFAKF